MAKANRKRANKPKEKIPKVVEKKKTIYEMFPARTLSQDDAVRMKEIFTLSNNVSALIRDYAEKDILIPNMRKMAESILKDKQPLTVQIAKNMFRTENDYEKVAKEILKQADSVEKSLGLLKGQIEHRYEDYLSTVVRLKRFLEVVIGKEENKVITGHRAGKVKDTATLAEEEVIFEKNFDDLTDEDREQLKAIDTEIKKAKETKND